MMAEKKAQAKKISPTSTKQDLLEAYNDLLQEVKETKEAELKPEEKREERKVKEVLDRADTLSAEGVAERIGGLKQEIGKMLSRIAENLEEEVGRLEGMKDAIRYREKEIQELYQIDREAASLAALIEAQSRKKLAFEEEMEAKRSELEEKIAALRADWERERQERDAESKEWAAAEKKRREREKDEFGYAFEREQKLVKDRFADEKEKLDKEIALKKEVLEKELGTRERAVVEKEAEFAELAKKAAAFPKELESAVAQAVKEVSERLTTAAKNREELAKREFEGERNVLNTRIASLEQTVKDQSEQIVRLTAQLEKAYQKIEDVALKTIEGQANMKALTSIQQLLGEQAKRQQTPER
jgi:hypothetical protein